MTAKKADLKLKLSKLESERAERRAVLEPTVIGVVSALGGYEDVLIKNETTDEGVGEGEGEGEDEGDELGQDLRTERVYKLGDECLGCLKDLKKFWRLDEDDENRTVARILHASQILPNDLLPILLSAQTENKKDYRVALLSSDLIAALTWPIDVDSELKEGFEVEDEESRRQATNIDYSSLLDAQLTYKRHIVRTGACGPIFRLLLPAIQKTKTARTEKDESVISLILHIIRNLLAIRDKAPSSQPVSGVEDSRLQSDLIVQLSKLGVFDLLIHMSHESNRYGQYGRWNTIVLDIWHMVFRGVDSEDLIDAEVLVGTNDVGEKISTVKQSDKKLESLLLGEEKARKAKARNSSTRHSRFGTTLSVNMGQKRYNLHSQTAITTPVEIALDARKQLRKKPPRLANEFGRPANLTQEALTALRSVVIEFIESGFNPFFMSVMDDIKSVPEETDVVRFFSLLGFFLKCFLKLRQREKSVGILPTSEAGHDFDLVAELIGPECLMWVVARIQGGLDQTPISAVEVHASVDCVIQQLLVIEGLSDSGVEQYTEAANTILNKLYYNAETLKMAVDLMSKYTDQSLKKKKTNRKPKKFDQVDGNLDEIETSVNPIDDEEQAYLDAEENKMSFTEHKFEFGKFQYRFATAAVVDTLMTYLRGYRNFSDPELMKRVVKLMYRQAVGAEAYKLFFRVSILNTFDSILEDKSMPKHQSYTDLIRFINYIIKQYFKCMTEMPFITADTLYKHTKKEWQHAMDPVDISNGRKGPKLPVEIVIQPGLTWSQRLGVAVGILVDKGQSDLVEKVKDILRTVSAARTAIALINDDVCHDIESVDISAWMEHPEEKISEELKAQLHQPSPSTLEKFEDHKVCAEEDAKEFKDALARNAQLHTLLRLLHWQSEEENPGFLSWTIPKVRTHCEIDVDIQVIDRFLIDPLDFDGKPLAEFTRRKRNKRTNKRSEMTAEELALDPSSSENEAPTRPAQRRQKKSKRRTKRSELTAEELALDESSENSDEDAENAKKVPRRRPQKPPAKKYLSAQFVADSDDEENEERDRIFFEKERQLRARMMGQQQPADLEISKPISKPLRPIKITKKARRAEEDSGLARRESSQSLNLDEEGPAASTSLAADGTSATAPGIVRRKRDIAEMVDELSEEENQADGNDSDVIKKSAKSMRLFIDSDDE